MFSWQIFIVQSVSVLNKCKQFNMQYILAKRTLLPCKVIQEASDAHSKTADSGTVSTYQVSSVQLVTEKKLEAFNKA